MIEFTNVSKSYQVGGTTIPVLRDISFQIGSGEFVSIMGPSGSGKSTLMHIIGCLDTPTSGQVSLFGASLASMTRDELARTRNREIGFVFQNFHLIARMTALRNVELPLVYAGWRRSKRIERATQLLTDVGLEHRLNHYPNELSGGQKQRVAIARALATGPSLILADEPTGALDTATGTEIMGLFQRLNQQGVTVVVVTHDDSIARYASRIIHVRDGEVVDN
ncbi:ABC transporter ATP-binding protein [Alicyclobacillus mengziensis]|uniref:ABC transporter ATP-binding protein n=1 Tax=Alicyclobacillus mengziensis TaxID=2931921 RepID=A0A9X7VZ53_9BACL|nr:ABC transporter ATP-binding protein [Alicyclobacillus mengziensis]QSO46373.1 ABC transporter ATP-binding protein [Alicyclobacillus mengziensis]